MSAAQPDNFHHVRDFSYLELPFGYHLEFPHLGTFEITKFMALQVLAAVIVVFIFRGLAKRIGSGKPAQGAFWNLWEMMALFIRDEVVRPTIGVPHHDHGHGHDEHANGHGDHGHGNVLAATAHGHDSGHVAVGGHGTVAIAAGHPADQYLPFVWSCFFYILICNLLGAIPFLGSATGNINVTAALALCAFVVTFISGARVMGVGGFFGNLIPETGVTGPAGSLLSVVMFVIELVGFLIKHSILALRLFGNMMGGHTALGVMLAFIGQAATSGMFVWGAVTVGSIVGQVGIGVLELLVAVLQAYVFSFLATIFIAGAIHKH